MLQSLHIENIAVVEKADIEFSNGLNVLTGETGAGKSIIIDSIGAVLGSKVYREIIRKNADYARVSAVFDCTCEVKKWLDENDFDIEDGELILSRKLTPEGKNTCRINGAPATLSQLRELSNLLIDIHGQNDGRLLLDERSHLRYLDLFGDYGKELKEFASLYGQFEEIEKKIHALQMSELEKSRLSDSLNAVINELRDAEIVPGEYDAIVSRRDLLRNAEKLTENINTAREMLDGDSDSTVLTLLENASYFIGKAASICPDLSDCLKKIQDAAFTVSDVAETLSDTLDSLDFSEEEYDSLENRIAKLSRLFRKYNRDEEELQIFLEESERKLEEIRYSDSLLEKYSYEKSKLSEKCLLAADLLHEKRVATAHILEERIEKELRELSMPGVQFVVGFEPIGSAEGFSVDGMDKVRFLMSANAGEDPGKISRIASGGELSRIMLALKNVFSEKDPVPTQIFDEIDAGVSGIAGQRVAEKLYNVAVQRQVMCVTHLPQIAAMADAQYRIEKVADSGRTYTNVQELDTEGRILELARLYGGDNITDITKKSAGEQLAAAEKYKNTVS